MEMLPTDEKKIRARISSYKSALKKEMTKFGYYSDGSGKRYSLFVLHFALGDLKKLQEYMDWYFENFSDDMGEPGQQLCWAFGLHRMGVDAEAEYRLADLMLSNLYIIPQLLGRDVQKHNMWHSSNFKHMDYIEYLPDGLIDTLTAEDLAWAAEKFDSSEFKALRTKYIELYAELQTIKTADRRIEILDEARDLLNDLRDKCR